MKKKRIKKSTKKVCNIYSKDLLANVGDRFCGPIQFFDFPFEIDEDIPSNMLDVIDKYDYIIFGGGGHIHIPSPDYNNGRFGHLEAMLPYASKIINWGIGHNVGHSEVIEYPDYMNKFALNGFRDIQRQGIDWVACQSCMDSAFDKTYEIKDTFRTFNKPGKPVEEGIYHSMEDGRDLTLAETVAFLGGAGTVITNSYHGAYWGLLLGRKVVVHNPDSSKFFGLLDDYQRTGSDLFLKPPVGYLDSCRKSNKDFFDVVKKVVG